MRVREYNDISYSDRQSRVWNCILYPESNENHYLASEILKSTKGALLVLHNNDFFEDGSKKETHYHCLVKYDNPFWLFSLVDRLELDNSDIHLFKTLKECGYKNIDDMIIYCSHIRFDDKTHYDISHYYGDLNKYAFDVLNKIDVPDQELFNRCLNDLGVLASDPNFKFMWLSEIYTYLCDNGHAYITYKQWNKIIKFIDDYKRLY